MQKIIVRTKRHYAGQEDAEPVIEWLNRSAGSPAGQRIAALVHDLASLSLYRQVGRLPTPQDIAWIEKHFPEVPTSGLREFANRRRRKARQAAEPGRDHAPAAFERARSRLARYTFRPWLRPPFFRSETGSSLFVVWEPSRRLTKAHKQEAWVIALLVGLAEDGLIDKIRQCSCGKWFFPRKSDSKECSPECYQERYRSTEEFKAKHRRDMRNRYQRERKK